MTTPEFEPNRRAALREVLASRVRSAPMRRKRLPWWGALSAFVAAGLIAGGAVSAAANAIQNSDQPARPFTIGGTAGLEGVKALPGTQPGTPIINLLKGGGSLKLTRSQTVPLTEVPKTATDVRVTVQCLSIGSLAWGTDPSGNNPVVTCAPPDPPIYYDFSVGVNPETLYLNVTGGEWIATYAYIEKVETAWGVNAQGQSYGVEKEGKGSPDLLAVVGTAEDGTYVDGYASAQEIQGPQPTSPSDAATFSERIREQYPHGVPVPVYKSDGTTRIGTFFVGSP